MSRKKVEGYWTCTYCGTKDIGGLTKKCPNCGNPQSKGLKFYLKDGPKKYLDSETAKNYGKGADWVCDYCGSYNKYSNVTCQNCSSPKSEAKENYFGKSVNVSSKEDYTSEHYMSDETFESESTKRRKNYETEYLKSPCNEEKSSDISYETDNDENQSYCSKIQNVFRNINRKTLFGIFGGSIAAISLIIFLISIFTPKSYDTQIIEKSWNKSVTIEELRTLNESDWDVPIGGRVYDERQEIKGYDHIIDHYETVEHKVSREEFDHYDYKYHDNGDGTFDEEKVPIYRTVYDTEYEKVPVYKDVPIYDTKYYYKIDRWCYDRTESSSGKTDNTYWPNFELGYKEREASRSETYTLYFETQKGKTYSKNISYEKWKEYSLGQKVKITVVTGIVTEIDP